MKWDIIQIRISEATRIYKCYKGFFRGSGLLVVRQDVEQLAMAYLKSAPSLGCSDVEDSDDDSWRQQIGRQSRSGRLVGKHFLPKKFWCMFISFMVMFHLSHQQKSVLVLLLKPGLSNFLGFFRGSYDFTQARVLEPENDRSKQGSCLNLRGVDK